MYVDLLFLSVRNSHLKFGEKFKCLQCCFEFLTQLCGSVTPACTWTLKRYILMIFTCRLVGDIERVFSKPFLFQLFCSSVIFCLTGLQILVRDKCLYCRLLIVSQFEKSKQTKRVQKI